MKPSRLHSKGNKTSIRIPMTKPLEPNPSFGIRNQISSGSWVEKIPEEEEEEVEEEEVEVEEEEEEEGALGLQPFAWGFAVLLEAGTAQPELQRQMKNMELPWGKKRQL
ncbi:hypothetical protein DUI87_31639 [Hirundo rustica rustica]|uniref:Uncharacterized protein n=1 Tax=Hirundo rustica rustica TaxID=333673 RepID=A0A3M0J027_HIRRU|nr:hypothetical protein DUI87_31639 [Hirundo rustica rustica]